MFVYVAMCVNVEAYVDQRSETLDAPETGATGSCEFSDMGSGTKEQCIFVQSPNSLCNPATFTCIYLFVGRNHKHVSQGLIVEIGGQLEGKFQD